MRTVFFIFMLFEKVSLPHAHKPGISLLRPIGERIH